METRAWADCSLTIEERDGEQPRLVGYAARFNSFSEDLGGFKEIIRPGAFRNALAAGDDVRLLINHDGLPLARTKSGTLVLSEDGNGLRAEVPKADATDPDWQRVMPKMRRGDLTQMSFAFTIGAQTWREEAGLTIREILSVDQLYDVSVVTFPAYRNTEVALRSLDAWKAEQAQENHADWNARNRMRLALAERA